MFDFSFFVPFDRSLDEIDDVGVQCSDQSLHQRCGKEHGFELYMR